MDMAAERAGWDMGQKGNQGGRMKTYLTLFTSSFYISAVTFGSGYVIIPVMKKRFVDELKWLEEEEMLNLIALAQSTPGVMTANTSLLVGYRVCGPAGAFLAVLGVVLPPLITISVLSTCYNAFRDNAVASAVLKGMQAGVCAVIFDVVVNLIRNVAKDKKVVPILIMVVVFAATSLLRVNVVLIIVLCALWGVAQHFIFGGKGEDE